MLSEKERPCFEGYIELGPARMGVGAEASAVGRGFPTEPGTC